MGNTGVEMAAVGNRDLRVLNLLVNLIQQSNSGHSGSKSRQYGVIGDIIFYRQAPKAHDMQVAVSSALNRFIT